MTSVALLVALPGEARSLTNARIESGRFLQLNEKTWLCQTGVGPQNASRAAEGLLQHNCGALISWGCAAAIAPDLKPGDLILPEFVIDASGTRFPVDPAWHQRLVQHLRSDFDLSTGPITESLNLVQSAREKQALHARTRATALDMESAALARFAAHRQLPFVTIRAIADPHKMDLPKPVAAAVDGQGEIRLSRLLIELARHPGSLPELIRLGVYFRSAQRELSRCARALQFDFFLKASQA